MFDNLILSPGNKRNQHGATAVRMKNVTRLLVSGGEYEGVKMEVEVEECEAWEEAVNCTDVFILGGVTLEDEGIPGLVIAALAVVFAFILVVGVVVGMNGIKSSDY